MTTYSNMAKTDPQIVIDGDDHGNAIVVWRQLDDIQAVTYTASNGWSTTETIESEGGEAEAPQVAVDGSGNAIAVWRQDDSTQYSIRANTYTLGDDSWGTAKTIENEIGEADAPQIDIDDSGNAIAVWRQSDGTRYSIRANTYTADNGWRETAKTIESDNAGTVRKPQIAVDDSGNAIAVWEQSDGTQYNIRANTYTAGNGWGATAEMIEVENGDAGAYDPQIAFNGSGSAIAVWRQWDGDRYNIRTNTYTASSGWGETAETIESDNAGSAHGPQIAFDNEDNAIAVWYQGDGDNLNIQANRFE